METKDILDQFPDSEEFAIDMTEFGNAEAEEQSEEAVEEITPSQEGEDSTEEVEAKAETETVEEDTPAEETIPFHKHPRWQKKQQEIEELRKEIEALKAKPSLEEPTTVKSVPVHLQKVFGNDVEAYEEYLKDTDNRALEKARQIVEESQQAQLQKQQEAERMQAEKERLEKEFIEWANDDLAKLGKEIGEDLGDEKNNVRNKILKIVQEDQIRDANGYPNFRAALKILKATQTDISDKRSIAKKTAPSHSGTPANPVFTPSQLRKSDPINFL